MSYVTRRLYRTISVGVQFDCVLRRLSSLNEPCRRCSRVRSQLVSRISALNLRYSSSSVRPAAGTDISSEDDPLTPIYESATATTVPPIKAEDFENGSLADQDKTRFAGKLQLRPYQQECIDNCLSFFERGENRIGISLATGSGKTVIFTNLIPKVKGHTQQATRSMIIVHRRELALQAIQHCRRSCPNLTIELELGDSQASGKADITVASIQSLHRNQRYLKYNRDDFKLILLDEAHHAVSKTYLEVLDYFGCCNSNTKIKLVGVSATLFRHDKVALDTVLDHIVYDRGFVSMMNDKWLSPVKFTTVKMDADLSKVRTTQKDFNISDLSQVVNTADNVMQVYQSWVDYALNEKRMSTLCFGVDIAHVEHLTDTFRQLGVDARYVIGATPKGERDFIIQAFRDKQFPILFNCGVLTEGTDIPNVDCIILARPTRSKNLLLQMIGRGMRLAPGKKDCHLIDMVGVSSQDLVTTPVLFGLPFTTTLHETTSDELNDMAEEERGIIEERLKRQRATEKLRQEVEQELAQRTSRSLNPNQYDMDDQFTTYKSILEFIETSQDETPINIWQEVNRSMNHWIVINPYRVVLNLHNFGVLRLDATPPEKHKQKDKIALKDLHWHINQMSKDYESWTQKNFKIERIVPIMDNISNFREALEIADNYVKQKKLVHRFMDRTAPWRSQPASAKQLEHLVQRIHSCVNKIANKAETSSPSTEKVRERVFAMGLTKHQAEKMLTRLQHGAAPSVVRHTKVME